MARRRADDLPPAEAEAIDRFLRDLRREPGPDWMTGGPDPAPGASGGFWDERPEDYGIGPDGQLIGRPQPPAWL